MKNRSTLFVIMLFGIIFSLGCKKKASVIPPPAGSQYTSRMGGARTWVEHYNSNISHGTFYYYIDTTYTYQDSVTVVNDTTIIIQNMTLNLATFDSTTNKISFYVEPKFSNDGWAEYFFLTDSIAYHIHNHLGASSDNYYDGHTQ